MNKGSQARDNTYIVGVRYGAPRVLTRANDRYAREDRVRREGGDDRPLDVKTVLQKRDGCVAWSYRRCDHIGHEGRDISNVLGGDDYEVVRGKFLLRDVGYAIAN